MTSGEPISPEAQERMERLLLALLDSGAIGMTDRALRDATRPMSRNDFSWAKLRCRRAGLIKSHHDGTSFLLRLTYSGYNVASRVLTTD